MPRPYVAVLFDVDDTLYRVADLVTAAWLLSHEPLRAAGLDAYELGAVYETQLARSGYTDALPRTLAILGASDVDPGWLLGLVEQVMPLWLTPYPGVRAGLDRLRARGVPVAAVTNGNPARQHAKLASLGLDGCFDAVVVADGDRVPRKPSPEPFLQAAAALGCRPGQLLMVGDRPGCDIAPAVRLGMGAVRLVAGNYADSPDVPGTLATVTCPAALWPVIGDLTAATGSPAAA